MPLGTRPSTGDGRNRRWIHTAAGAATSPMTAPMAKRRFTKPGGRCRGRNTAATSRQRDNAERAIIQERTAATSRQKRTGARMAMPTGDAGAALAAAPVAGGPATPVSPAARGRSRNTTAARPTTRRPNLIGSVCYVLWMREVPFASLADLLSEAEADRHPGPLGALEGLLGFVQAAGECVHDGEVVVHVGSPCQHPGMRNSVLLLLFAPLMLAASAAAPDDSTRAAAGAAYTVRSLPLPGANDDGIFMDYIAFDPHTGFVWAPAGNTGAVDVVDTATGKVTQISGFPTTEVEVRGRKRTIGPSSATVGDGVVYVGNRADSTVCAVDARSLVRGACGRLDSMPDGLAYVAPTRELWVTTPRDKSVRILDGATLSQKAKLGFDGQPEGFAVDAARGRFYTNLEDKDRTLAIDLKSHQTVATWNPKCGEEGPHGLRIDEKGGLLFVACSTRTEALDAGH